jgi:PAS domain S-box-containing protein
MSTSILDERARKTDDEYTDGKILHEEIKAKPNSSEARYKEILDEQTELICRYRKDGSITYANAAYYSYFGKTAEEQMGHGFVSSIPLDDQKRVKRNVTSLTPDNPVVTVEHRVYTPDGQERWQFWTDSAIFDDQGNLLEYQSVGRDCTQHKEIEKTLKESEDRFRKLISKMCNGFALFEVVTDRAGEPKDCRFLEVNPAFNKIFGLKTDNIIGKTIRDVLPGTESFWVDQCSNVARTGKSIHFKHGSKLYGRFFEVVAYSPQKGQVAIVFTELTERMRMEAALREGESNFKAIAENANDGILIAMGKGLYVYANRRASEITGFSKTQLSRLSFKDLVRSDEVTRVGQIYKKRLEGKRVPTSYETIIVTKNGTKIPIEVTGSKTIWKGQAAVMVIIRDITLRKRFEEAMGKMHNELERRVHERTQELINVAEKLDEKQKELLRHKLDLEKANKELVQTNTALSVLARNIDKKRDEVEKRIAQIISSQIMPLLEEAKNDSIPEKSRVKLEVIAVYLNDLTPETAKGHDIIISLSAMELRIAMMIKNGFTSEEIARLLHISPFTVKTHRRSIRKKLKISNSSINLASYLKLKLGKTSNHSGMDASKF